MEEKKIYSVLIVSIVLLFSCTGTINKKINDKWDVVKLDDKISENVIYKDLNKQTEIFSFFEKRDSLAKRTSGVSYFSGKNTDLNKGSAKFNNCRAYFFNSDTLSINIGIGNGFGAKGFIIKLKGNKFCTKAYF